MYEIERRFGLQVASLFTYTFTSHFRLLLQKVNWESLLSIRITVTFNWDLPNLFPNMDFLKGPKSGLGHNARRRGHNSRIPRRAT
mgnify:CR=1 FL=1